MAARKAIVVPVKVSDIDPRPARSRCRHPPHGGVHEHEGLGAEVAGPQHEPAAHEDDPPAGLLGPPEELLDDAARRRAEAEVAQHLVEPLAVGDAERAGGEHRDREQPEEQAVGDAAGEHAGRDALVAVGEPEADVDRPVRPPGVEAPRRGALGPDPRPLAPPERALLGGAPVRARGPGFPRGHSTAEPPGGYRPSAMSRMVASRRSHSAPMASSRVAVSRSWAPSTR